MNDTGRRFASIATLAALGVWLVACQREDLARSKEGAGAKAAQKQSVIGFAQTLKDRMRQCTGDLPDAEIPKASVPAWATVERDQETNCTQLMMDLGSGEIFPRDWPEDQSAKFRRALNTYAKYAAQNMARSQNEAMFMESIEGDEDASGKVERYTKAMGPRSVTFRDRGEKLFEEAAKDYGVGARDIHLPDS